MCIKPDSIGAGVVFMLSPCIPPRPSISIRALNSYPKQFDNAINNYLLCARGGGLSHPFRVCVCAPQKWDASSGSNLALVSLFNVNENMI